VESEIAITEVRGTEVRCSGNDESPHPDLVLVIPAGKTVVCPKCGQLYRRTTWWNVISGAIWPSPH
jgi:uncharacterized Zn-finger protein